MRNHLRIPLGRDVHKTGMCMCLEILEPCAPSERQPLDGHKSCEAACWPGAWTAGDHSCQTRILATPLLEVAPKSPQGNWIGFGDKPSLHLPRWSCSLSACRRLWRHLLQWSILAKHSSSGIVPGCPSLCGLDLLCSILFPWVFGIVVLALHASLNKWLEGQLGESSVQWRWHVSWQHLLPLLTPSPKFPLRLCRQTPSWWPQSRLHAREPQFLEVAWWLQLAVARPHHQPLVGTLELHHWELVRSNGCIIVSLLTVCYWFWSRSHRFTTPGEDGIKSSLTLTWMPVATHSAPWTTSNKTMFQPPCPGDVRMSLRWRLVS